MHGCIAETMRVRVENAGDGKHKLVVRVEGGPSIRFGAYGYSDYTTSGDTEKKAAYIKRHAVRENWRDPSTRGFWARWLLWNRPTLEQSKADVTRRFQIEFL